VVSKTLSGRASVLQPSTVAVPQPLIESPYDVYIDIATPDNTPMPHLRYRFTHCVRATATSALPPEAWRCSLDERLLDFEEGRELDGYVWGVRWQMLYPGLRLVHDSTEATAWTHDVGIPFHEAAMQTNGHNLSLIFSDLVVSEVRAGCTPFTVTD
jgi:hypothetical protein